MFHAGCLLPALALSSLLLPCEVVAVAGAVREGEGFAPEECSGCWSLDRFDEALDLLPVPHTASPPLALARVDFTVEADMSAAFRAGQFDLFPKSVGKLLNAHRSIVAFEAVLTQGRWKEEEWGPALRELRPPGALLVAATATNSSDTEADDAWRFLISALSGSLCASFEGMDPAHKSSGWVRPSSVPWVAPGQQLRFATLPYEPVCTENLTPWLKLLPCGRRKGLAALLAPLMVAESPLVSLTLAVVAHEATATVTMRASLDMVLPVRPEEGGLAAWLGAGAKVGFAACPAARSSLVRLTQPTALRHVAAAGAVNGQHSILKELPMLDFAALEDSASKWLAAADAAAPKQEEPWLQVQTTHSPSGQGQGGGLAVMRDVLSQEGKSERTHGRYLLRFTNSVGGVMRRVRFMDHLPFFLRPLWHTIQVVVQRSGSSGAAETFTGTAAMRRLGLAFVPSDGGHSPTEVFLTVDVLPGSTVSVFLDILKSFIQLREFSYSCEKGFDVGSAAWFELDLPSSGEETGAALAEVGFDDFAAALLATPQGHADAARGTSAAAQGSAWRLRFTEGLLVLVPMPDFSMPFNVIALTSTAVTFFFGSIFRLTGAGRLPHWVLKKPDPVKDKAFWTKRALKWLLAASLAAGCYALHISEMVQLQALREALPPEIAGTVMEQVLSLKGMLAEVFGDGSGH